VEDTWGNRWSIATHVEDVSDEEVERRMKAMATA
jgi:PhnB protein